MSQNLVNFKDFKIENLIIGSIVKKTSKMDPSAQYNECSISYNYEKTVNGDKILINDDLYLEFPEVNSNGGILKKENLAGKVEASILATFELSDPEIARFVNQGSLLEPDEQGIIGQIYYTILKSLFKEKSKVSSFNRITKEENLESLCTPLLYWAFDEQGLIKGKNPSKYFPLINYGAPGTFLRRETLFNTPSLDKNGKPNKINWNDLEGVNVSFIPNVHFKKVYISQKASIQTEIVSCVVTKINKIGDDTSQLSTIERLIAKRPDIVSQVEANISTIKNLRLNKTPEEEAPKKEETITLLTNSTEDTSENTCEEDSDIPKIVVKTNILNLPGLKNLQK